MRLIFATVSSAALLSACSWFGGSAQQYGAGQAGFGLNGASQAGHLNAIQACQIYHAQQAIPRGCHPSQVTLATGWATGGAIGGQNANFAGGFPQQPDFSSGSYGEFATGGFGSQVNRVSGPKNYHQSAKSQKRLPKLRGQLSFTAEDSFAGDFLNSDDFAAAGLLLDGSQFNARNEGFITGSAAEGQIVSTSFIVNPVEQVIQDDVSFDSSSNAPLNVRGGLEYVLGPKTTIFANAGYAFASGGRSTATVQGEIDRVEVLQNFDTVTLDAGGAPTLDPLGAPITNVAFVPNVDVGRFDFEFSDLDRIDLEVGGRRYLNPVLGNLTETTVTPFVGASLGASRFSDQSFSVSQSQVLLQEAQESGGTNLESFDVFGTNAVFPTGEVTVYDSQWVPTGTLTAGIEMQVTPKSAIAFESGVRYEGRRESAGGFASSFDSGRNFSVPFTIRGSYNF